MQPLLLKIAEALGKDMGRAYARLDPADMSELGAAIGDILEITGKRRTYCKAMPSYQDMRGRQRIQLDGITRENLRCALDEPVQVRKARCEPADTVEIAPLRSAPEERDMSYIGSLLDGLPVKLGDRIRATLFGNRWAEFSVRRTVPTGPVLIHPATRLIVTKAPAPPGPPAPLWSYEDIGGLKPQLQRVRELIELPLRHPQIFQRLGIEPPKGVLLHGPPGCGKTLIARAIAHETEAAFFAVNGPEIIHKFYGESEAHLRKIFEDAGRRKPSIIFLDEIDAIAPKRERVIGDVEKRVVAQLLALMDGLKQRHQVVVIAATNIPNALDPALRRPGRFDREIAIPIPDRHSRGQILEIHSRGMPLSEEVDLGRLADRTHGFVGADLEALCREAAMICLRRNLATPDFSLATATADQWSALNVVMNDFEQALKDVEPSAIREVFVEIPNVSWTDVAGLEQIKAALREAVEWPFLYPALLERFNSASAKGILLSGPPGCGKTLLAKAVANQSRINFIPVKGPELLSKYVGESERAVREVFGKARQAAPCILFFDEIDGLLPLRGGESASSGVTERVLSQFLTELDGIEELKGVVVLAATNRLDRLDPALLRPGRFDQVIEVPLPGRNDRQAIFSVHLDKMPVRDVNPEHLAEITDGFSGADIAAVCRHAAMAVIRRLISETAGKPDAAGEGAVTGSDLEAAVNALLAVS